MNKQAREREIKELRKAAVSEFIFDIDMIVSSGEYKYSNVTLECVETLANSIGYKLISSK